MKKIKSNKSAQKRFKKIGSDNYKHKKANHVHILTKKNAKRKQGLSGLGLVNASDKGRVDQMLPDL